MKTHITGPIVAQTLDPLLPELRVKTRTKALQLLVEHYKKSMQPTGIVATYENIMNTSPDQRAPVLITGPAGSGKTYTTIRFLKDCLVRRVPFFVLDTQGEPEYGFVPHNLPIGEAWSFKFGRPARNASAGWRVIPSSNRTVRVSQVEFLFQSIMMQMYERKLENWVFVIEEAHNYENSSSVLSFVAEARKFVRKAIVVSSKLSPWGEICSILGPLPRPNSPAPRSAQPQSAQASQP